MHGGVLEFDAPEGTAYLPPWMMNDLGLDAGGIVKVTNVTLPAGKSVVFQPHSHTFTKLSNPRSVLETVLSKFSCLTQGQTVPVKYRDTV